MHPAVGIDHAGLGIAVDPGAARVVPEEAAATTLQYQLQLPEDALAVEPEPAGDRVEPGA